MLSELRKNLSEQRRLAAEQQASEDRASSPSRGPVRTATTSIGFLALVVVGLALAAALGPDRPMVRVLSAAAAGIGCALLDDSDGGTTTSVCRPSVTRRKGRVRIGSEHTCGNEGGRAGHVAWPAGNSE